MSFVTIAACVMQHVCVCQVCWNAAVVPLRHSRLWGGVQSVRFTNTSDLGANSSLARQSYVVQRLLQVTVRRSDV